MPQHLHCQYCLPPQLLSRHSDDDEIADLLSSSKPEAKEEPGTWDKASDLAQVSCYAPCLGLQNSQQKH